MSDRVAGAERFVFTNKTKGSKLAPSGITIQVKISPNPHGTLLHDLAPEEEWVCYPLLKDSEKVTISLSEKPSPRGSTAYGDYAFEREVRDGKVTTVMIRTDEPSQCLHVLETTG
jgi:hypothetical protein